MNAPELQALRRLLFFSVAEAARWIAVDADRPRGVEERTWNRWESGKAPIPINIAAAVLELLVWHRRELAAVRQLVAARASPDPLRLLTYPDGDDWPADRRHWRPSHSVAAHLLAEQPGAVRLVAFDPAAFHAWRRARNQVDDAATRADWAAAVDLSPQPPAGDGLPPGP